jgi:hypothetical protein
MVFLGLLAGDIDIIFKHVQNIGINWGFCEFLEMLLDFENILFGFDHIIKSFDVVVCLFAENEHIV